MKKNPHTSRQKMPMGEVRIISGLWRGRKLPVLAAEGLRPTTDRVKETLFNWLMQSVAGSRCLDCFAGSGALGLEALSRQATFVQFYEKNPQAVKILKQNINTLGVQNSAISQGDTLVQLAQANRDAPFDLVFIDPPFHHGLVPQTLEKLIQFGWLAPDALLYIEVEKTHAPLSLPAGWRIEKEKCAGMVKSYLICASAPKGGENA